MICKRESTHHRHQLNTIIIMGSAPSPPDITSHRTSIGNLPLLAALDFYGSAAPMDGIGLLFPTPLVTLNEIWTAVRVKSPESVYV